MKNRKKYLMHSFCFFIGMNVFNAHAEIKIEPSVLVKGTYIDNENRSVKPVSADIIAEVAPNISISVDSVRAKGNLDYTLRKQASYTRNINNLNHVFQGTGNYALIKNYVNLFAIGNYGQRTNRIGQNILFDQTLQLENISDFGSASGGIDMTNRIKRYFDSKLRYTYNTSQSNSPIIADTSSTSLVASLSNGTNFRRLIWGGDANYRELDYENRTSIKSAEVTGKLGYFINSKTGLSLSAGYESNPQYLRVRPNSPSRGYIATMTAFWRSPQKLGFELMAGKRAYGKTYQISTDWESNGTSLRASAGKTVINNTYSISLRQKIHQAVFRLQYNESLSDYNYASFTEIPLLDAQINQNQLVSPPLLLPSVQVGTYIIRRASSGVVLQGIKNKIELGADYSTRTYSNTGFNSKTYKATSQWQHKLNALANTNLTVEAVNANDRTIGAKGRYTSVKLGYDHKIKKVFMVSLSGQRWTHKPGDDQNIVVNLVNFSVKATY